MTVWQTILTILTSVATSVLAFGPLSLAAVWLAQTWVGERLRNGIRAEYDQKLETHKAQLKAQGEVEIERLRSQLGRLSEEHRVRYGLLGTKRAEVIGELFAHLQNCKRTLEHCVSPFIPAGAPTEEDRFTAYVVARFGLVSFFDHHRLYLPAPVAGEIEGIVDKLVATEMTFRYVVMPRSGNPATIDVYQQLWDDVQGPISKAIRDLEDTFRGLLNGEP